MKPKNGEQLTISVDSKTIVRVVAIVIGALLLLSFLETIEQALKILFIAAFLAMALNPAVSWLAKIFKRRSRLLATGVAYLLVLAILAGFIALVFPPLIRQSAAFVNDVPQTIKNFRESDSAVSRFVYKYQLDKEVDDFATDFEARFSDVGKPILTTAGAVGSAVVATITVLVLTFMMLVEGPSWVDRIVAIQPKSKRAHRKELMRRMYRTVTGYVNGQVIISFIAGFFAFVALLIMSSIFDANINEVALAGIVALFALMPLIGATLGAVIVVTACLFVSLPLAIGMAIYFIVYQQIENATIQPYIQSKNSNLTALLVLIAALIGVSFAGILGAFVAIPAAACIKILLEDHYHARLEKAKVN